MSGEHQSSVTLLLGESRYSLNKKLNEPQRPSEIFGDEKNFLSDDGIKNLDHPSFTLLVLRLHF